MNTRVKCKCKKIKREKKKIFQKQEQNRTKGQQIVYQINKTIIQYFPDLIDRMQELPDYRERKHYEIAELLTGGIAMFLFKEGSRNAINNDRKEAKFSKNYQRLFKLRLPHPACAGQLMTYCQYSRKMNWSN